MVLDITKGKDNPILRIVSPKQGKITKKTMKLLKDMEETMLATDGVGIAAPQVGVNLQIACITINKKQVLPIINPEILEKSTASNVDTEGCLSLPGVWGPVERSNEITLRFTNSKGKQLTMKFSDFEARVVQHEVDHLNGILFIDHVAENELQIEGGLAL